LLVKGFRALYLYGVDQQEDLFTDLFNGIIYRLKTEENGKTSRDF
jgi:hypothetical protein